MGKFGNFDKILLLVTVVSAVLSSVSIFRLFSEHNVEKRQVILLGLQASNYERGHRLKDAKEAMRWARSLAASCSAEQYARVSLDLAGILEKSGDVQQAAEVYREASVSYASLLQNSVVQDSIHKQVFAEGACWSNDGILRLCKAAKLPNAVALAAQTTLLNLANSNTKVSDPKSFSVQWLEIADILPSHESDENQIEKRQRVLKDYRRQWINRTNLDNQDDVKALTDCARHAMASGDLAMAREAVSRLLSDSQSTFEATDAVVAGSASLLTYLDYAYNRPVAESLKLFAECEPLLSKCSDPPTTGWLRSWNYSRFGGRAITDEHNLRLALLCGNNVCKLAARTESPMKEQMLSFLVSSLSGARVSHQGKVIRSELMRHALSDLQYSDGQFRAACLLQLCYDELDQHDARVKLHIQEISELLPTLPQDKSSSTRLKECVLLIDRPSRDKALAQLGLAVIEAARPEDPSYPAILGRCGYVLRSYPEFDRKAVEHIYKLLSACLDKHANKYSKSSAATGYVYLAENLLGNDFSHAAPYVIKAQKLLEQSPDMNSATKITDLQIMFDAARENPQATKPAARRVMEQLASACLVGRPKAFGERSYEHGTTLTSIAFYEMKCGNRKRAQSLNNHALAVFKQLGAAQNDGFLILANRTKAEIEKRGPGLISPLHSR